MYIDRDTLIHILENIQSAKRTLMQIDKDDELLKEVSAKLMTAINLCHECFDE